jgi:hypothetical protein
VGAAALQEASFLVTFCRDAKHFAVQAVLGSGSCGVVFAVKCTHVDFPFPGKVLRVKVTGPKGKGCGTWLARR